MGSRDMLRQPFHQDSFSEKHHITPATVVVSILAGIYIAHWLAVRLDYSVLSLSEIFWNVLVFLVPTPLLLDSAQRNELRNGNMQSQTHAAKSEALRAIIGLGNGTALARMPTNVGGEVVRRMSMGAREWANLARRRSSIIGQPAPVGDVPPGLGNWDNSCYQNSVLQGLSALPSLRKYLGEEHLWKGDPAISTRASLLELIDHLSGGVENGKTIWTPAKLKNMSSWQQQDAQEYFSKILEELDKEIAKSAKENCPRPTLSDLIEGSKNGNAGVQKRRDAREQAIGPQNPLEGWLAQRVACTQCGFSEGLSMIPFNCLTVPLGQAYDYDLSHCLDEYTKLEEITEVECAKCTLLAAETQLKKMLERVGAKPPLPTPESTPEPEFPGGVTEANVKATLGLPPEIRINVMNRLAAIEEALEKDEFEDKALNERCQISKKAKVSSTKTRQAVIGRAPQDLVIHVNRSVFDEYTGMQKKNYAALKYPLRLHLGPWILGGENNDGEIQRWCMDATRSMLEENEIDTSTGPVYRLQAVVTHYGRHENGHYIAYRRHNRPVGDDLAVVDEEAEMNAVNTTNLHGIATDKWWRLSDEDVSAVSEQHLLDQGGVFMLFYEREPKHGEVTPTMPSQTTTGRELSHLKSDLDTSSVADNHHLVESPSSMVEPGSDNATKIDMSPPKDNEGSSIAQTGSEMSTVNTKSADTSPSKTSQRTPTMRTARGRRSTGQGHFAGGFRPIAAT